MEHTYKHEELPSGKTVMKDFDGEGVLVEEMHAYGLLDIGIKYDFRGGVKVEETYFAKRRMVSRRTYEKARMAYPDMPPADSKLPDWGADLIRGMARERKERAAAAECHVPDADEAAGQDGFCVELMEKGRTEDAESWVQTKMHTLGEREWSESKRLVKRLSNLGCVRIHACEIDTYEDGMENTGHLVVELPTDIAARKKILKAIDRLAEEQGYSGDLDNGQKFAYIKLD